VTPARWSVAVVVPARDEAALVGGCIASVLAARVPPGCDRWVVVVADRCTDATATLVGERLGDGGEVLVSGAGNVGAARRVGSAAALARFVAAGRSLRSVWLLGTDADGTVPVGWIESHLRQADAGAVGVAGTVAVPSFAEHPPEVAQAFADRYVVEADGSHAHVHGANLGVRADAYRDVGGWRPLATGEDHDLWGRLRAAGHSLISTLEAPVLTSGRRAGRAPAGFAGLLASLAEPVEGTSS
jgi:glycosyltransferase involved in cell wall biosynthesis